MIVTFSEMDRTLSGQEYPFYKAKESLKLIIKNKILLILCSSRTYDKLISLRKKIKEYLISLSSKKLGE